MKPTDAELDLWSDKVRRGEPIGLHQAIAVIDYQERLRANTPKRWLGRAWTKILRWHRAANHKGSKQ